MSLEHCLYIVSCSLLLLERPILGGSGRVFAGEMIHGGRSLDSVHLLAPKRCRGTLNGAVTNIFRRDGFITWVAVYLIFPTREEYRM